MLGRFSPLAARNTQFWLLGPAVAVALLSSACLPLLPAPTQATAEAKLAALKAGPKPEVLAAAQANYNAAQARVKSLQSARDNADSAALDQRVKEARAALDQAQAALKPDADAVAQAEATAA